MVRGPSGKQAIVALAGRPWPWRCDICGSVYRKQSLEDHVRQRALPLPARRSNGTIANVSVLARDGVIVTSRRRVMLLSHDQVLRARRRPLTNASGRN